ncbi:hemicentin-1-like isoform X2 [Anneissia japonica]|uniref:hemicentin-1-like isoform X2 n=1 Tax=Anneissia japonica TaxID=1529436 RepID=UPI0014257E77|nr:hemicentin-1-like isoform X2 [Anneissia japonica]
MMSLILDVWCGVFLILVIPSDFSMGEEVVVTPSYSKEGNTAIIECKYSNIQLTVLSWYRANEDEQQVGDLLVSNKITSNGRYSLNTTSDNSGDLYITSTTRDDTGNYLCTVVSSTGTLPSDVASLTVQYLDVPSLTVPSSPVPEGSTTTLYCSLPDGVPTPIEFFWMKDNVLLDLTNNARLRGSLNNQNLTIEMVDVNDAGDYSCRAENSVYSGTDGRTSNIIKLEIYYTRITSLSWVGGVVTCMAEGNPTPAVMIEVDSSVVDSGSLTASASVPCDTTSIVKCSSDNGENQVISQDIAACSDGCQPNPCRNGGVCMSSNTKAFQCKCTSGFQGVTCQNDDGSNVGLIVGLVVAVIVIAIVIVFLYCRNRDKMSETNVGYSSKPADVEVKGSDNAARVPLKGGPGYEVMPSMTKTSLGMNRDLQKSNEKLFDAREDAVLYDHDGGKPVGVMI